MYYYRSDDEETTEENSTNTFDAETFLQGIYQTAEQGVALLSSLLDIPVKWNQTSTIKTTIAPETSTEAQRRGPKLLKHPNQL